MEEQDVILTVYDFSLGMGKLFTKFGKTFMKKFFSNHDEFKGIWHTGIRAFGEEYFFGGGGVEIGIPTPHMGAMKFRILGKPLKEINLGRMDMDKEAFHKILRNLSDSRFKKGTYNLVKKNCNTFSNELAIILVGKGVPEKYLSLQRGVHSRLTISKKITV